MEHIVEVLKNCRYLFLLNFEAGRRGFREGDSGGALVTAGEHAEQIGIVSWWLKDDAEGIHNK